MVFISSVFAIIFEKKHLPILAVEHLFISLRSWTNGNEEQRKGIGLVNNVLVIQETKLLVFVIQEMKLVRDEPCGWTSM